MLIFTFETSRHDSQMITQRVLEEDPKAAQTLPLKCRSMSQESTPHRWGAQLNTCPCELNPPKCSFSHHRWSNRTSRHSIDALSSMVVNATCNFAACTLLSERVKGKFTLRPKFILGSYFIYFGYIELVKNTKTPIRLHSSNFTFPLKTKPLQKSPLQMKLKNNHGDGFSRFIQDFVDSS